MCVCSCVQEGIADEHMVDANRKTNARGVGRKKTARSRFSRSTTPPPLSPSSSSNFNTATTTTSGGVTTTTTTLASSLTSSSIITTDKSKDESLLKDPANHPGQAAASQSTGKSDSLKSDKDPSPHHPHPPPPSATTTSSNSSLEPFKSSSLPEEKTNHHSLSTSLNRKRERSPSPTMLLNSKRSSIQSDGVLSRGSNSVSNLLVSHGGTAGKAPSPTPNSILGNMSGVGKGSKDGPVGMSSSASRVLNEEITKQENSKLKVVIIREVRKPGQSKSSDNMHLLLFRLIVCSCCCCFILLLLLVCLSLGYDTLFQHLENIRGTLETRETFVGDIIKEAGRFKRKKLVQQLEEWKTNLKTGFSGSHLNNKRNKLAPPATGKR